MKTVRSMQTDLACKFLQKVYVIRHVKIQQLVLGRMNRWSDLIEFKDIVLSR